MANAEETKRDKFVRLAEARTNKILSMIQLLGNCSNKGSYEYTDQDVNKIFGAIETELGKAKHKFQAAKEENTVIKFSLR